MGALRGDYRSRWEQGWKKQVAVREESRWEGGWQEQVAVGTRVPRWERGWQDQVAVGTRLGESEGDGSKNTYCEWISAPRSTEKNYITDKGIVHRYSTVGTINLRQIQRHKNQYIEYPYTWETVPIWLLTGSPQIQVDSSTAESY